jgi:hypothetical protein
MNSRQANSISKRHLFTVAGLVFVAVAAFQASRISAPWSGADPKTQINGSASWEHKAVQIEQLWSDGQWYPREPLPLRHGYSIRGHSAGQPDFTVRVEPMYRTSGEPGSLYLARSIKATCADGKVELSTVLHHAEKSSWVARLGCQEGTWRLKIVDSITVLRPPQAEPGEMLPEK